MRNTAHGTPRRTAGSTRPLGAFVGPKPYLLTSLFAYLVLMALIVVGCEKPATTIPAPLLGIWKSTDPNYVDRSMRFTLERVYFGTGEGEATSHRVVAVHPRELQNITEYAIEYLNKGEDIYTLKLDFYRGSNELRLANRDFYAWIKKSKPPTL